MTKGANFVPLVLEPRNEMRVFLMVSKKRCRLGNYVVCGFGI
jgi:hypothetical protein